MAVSLGSLPNLVRMALRASNRMDKRSAGGHWGLPWFIGWQTGSIHILSARAKHRRMSLRMHQPNPGNDKALNNQGFALPNMAEA
ncbi:hypothetical protein [Pseudomonas syringae]|uniref:hypothetical protein n=1 Tax=Pseudomonas syringae TaxID=317 RepID=UPI0013C351F4|nr:hypothetical protein [Pseudomonas syringae]